MQRRLRGGGALLRFGRRLLGRLSLALCSLCLLGGGRRLLRERLLRSLSFGGSALRLRAGGGGRRLRRRALIDQPLALRFHPRRLLRRGGGEERLRGGAARPRGEIAAMLVEDGEAQRVAAVGRRKVSEDAQHLVRNVAHLARVRPAHVVEQREHLREDAGRDRRRAARPRGGHDEEREHVGHHPRAVAHPVGEAAPERARFVTVPPPRFQAVVEHPEARLEAVVEDGSTDARSDSLDTIISVIPASSSRIASDAATGPIVSSTRESARNEEWQRVVSSFSIALAKIVRKPKHSEPCHFDGRPSR